MFDFFKRIGLVGRIVFAIVLGGVVGYAMPSVAQYFSLFGDLFIKALLSVAPILVFILVMSSIANFQVSTQQGGNKLKPLLVMYVIGMLLASGLAVAGSLMFPSTLLLDIPPEAGKQAPDSVITVLKNLVLSFFMNPVTALHEAKFIGILVWAVVLGLGLRHASDTTKQVLTDVSNAVNYVIRLVIQLAPLGIFGLVTVTVAETGMESLAKYAHLLAVLLGCMLLVAFVVNPLMVALVTRQNPFPLVMVCLRESAITAFFTRSSAANIPVNLALAKRLGVNDTLAGVAIPLGAAINMSGAAITIAVLTLAAVHTLGIQTDLSTMLILSVVATVSACGASGVAGGSLLLIPVACSLFGIPSEVAMQVVAIGVLISVLQDSAETALNSSTDVLFTVAIDQSPYFNKSNAEQG